MCLNLHVIVIKKPVQNSLFFSRSLIQILVQFHECVGAGNG